MKKSLCIVVLLSLFASTAFSQTTWLPVGDYRLYSAEYVGAPLKGVSYTIASSDSNETLYTNYIQFSDFPGILMQPMQPGDYTMMDSVGPFGHHTYFHQSDEVLLFKMGIRLPNHPAPQQIYPCYTDSSKNVHIKAVSGDWMYSNDYKDSILSFTLMVYSLSGQAEPQHPLNAKMLSYGQNSGLISFPLLLNYTSGQVENSRLLYSENLNPGTLPATPEEVFDYEPGNEYHSIRTVWHSGLVDSSLIIRKILTVNKNGSLIERIDSVYEATSQYGRDSTHTWRQYGLTKYSKHIDTVATDLDEYSFFGTNRTQTAVLPYHSMHNQEYFIVENNLDVSAFILVAGRELPYADQLTPTPPYAYRSQKDPLFHDVTYSYYYPNAGGPFLSTVVKQDSKEEKLVYISDNGGERGDPLDPSLVNSLQKPLLTEIRLYPNPANEYVQLHVSETGTWEATIYSIQGREMSAFTFDGASYSIDVNHLPGGVYLIHLSNGIHSGSARLLILRGN